MVGPIPRGVQGQARWIPGQSEAAGGAPGYIRRIGNGWALRSFSPQTILWLYEILHQEVPSQTSKISFALLKISKITVQE